MVLLDGFERRDIATAGARIRVAIGGEGPPMLLLHGFPQTHVMWHRVAPRLAERYTVVAADLRGYGDSAKPATTPNHMPYSKSAMAADQVEVMRALGFSRFFLVGHDRGGRVAHRLALDHPEAVAAMSVLDIAPTWRMYKDTTKEFATAYYHWFFLIQPHPFPETLIGHDPEFYLRWGMNRSPRGIDGFAPEALAEYIRCFRDPATIHATCEDYRAAASIDLAHDEMDMATRIACPLLVLWGRFGVIERCFDALAAWRERAAEVSGRALDCGHYIPEEAPDALLDELGRFFDGRRI
ncbi:MAG: alpha/beta hydrolase [Alphaproteobacteria bacterium]|nr:alpha/beta hydrolase [Alphaproteobacteria bacterium]